MFDEQVFPFANLHENARARLRKEILLLPNHLLNNAQGGVICVDPVTNATNPIASTGSDSTML